MKKQNIFLGAATLALALSFAAMPIQTSIADDTELFTQPPGAVQPPPNVMVVVDSSANWNSNNQHWATGKQGAAELLQLKSVIGQLSGQNVAVGLMLMTNSPYGGYVRVAPRNMSNPSNATALQAMFDDIYQGNFGSGSGSNDEIPAAKADYSSLMYEIYNFYSGAAAFSGQNSSMRDYAGNMATYSASKSYGLTTGNALASAAATNYTTPLSAIVPCAKNYLVFIGNGLPNNDSSMPSGSSATISALNGGVAPGVVSIPGYPTAQANWMDEWAKFLYTHGAAASNGISGSIVTYAIDVYKDQQDINQTMLFKSAARVGGGRYFAATNDVEINAALTHIFAEIQSVSSVFSSATLPVSVNVRGTNLNQVYLGVFRPDADALPSWAGNLKEYKLGVNVSGGLDFIDVNGALALSTNTGFFNQSTVSFWTSGNTYWAFNADPSAQNPNSDSADGPLVERGAANEMLRWNATAGTTKLASARTVYTYTTSASPSSPVTMDTGYLFNKDNASLTPGLFDGVYSPSTTPADRDNIIDWIRGTDLNDENGDGATTDMRPKAHGDVVHSRPSVINYNRYGDDNDVAIFYGANDGLLHAIQGGQAAPGASGRPDGGTELWSFAAPEFFPSYPRQYMNTPTISWSHIQAFFTGNGLFASGSTATAIFSSNSNIAVGQTVSGIGIASGTTVAATSLVNGATLSSAATATNSGTQVQVSPPGSPMANATLTNGSNYAVMASPPAWLVSGMSLSGTGIPAGTTVSSVVNQPGAGLAGGVLATSANAGATYSFSNSVPGTTTTADKLMVVAGSASAYRIGTGSLSSRTGELYTSTGSSTGANIPTGATLSGGAAQQAIILGTAPTGNAGTTLSAPLTLVAESTPAASDQRQASNSTSSSCLTGATCTIALSASGTFYANERVNISGCSVTTPFTVNTNGTGTSLKINRNNNTCTIAKKAAITIYPTYTLAGVVAAVGQATMPITGTITYRGATLGTLPTTNSYVLKTVSSNNPVSLDASIGLSATPTSTAVYRETLSAAAAGSVFGTALFSKMGTTSSPAAVCTGDTSLNGSSVFNLISCTTGTIANILSGMIVVGPGIPVGTATTGVSPAGFYMSQAATTTGVQSVSAYYPWVANTVNGSPYIQVSSPASLSLVPTSDNWNIIGAGIPAGALSSTTTGLVQFVTINTATTSSSGGGGNSLTFTNPSVSTAGTGPKPYFFDGSVGMYRHDAPNTGSGASLTGGDGKIIAGSCSLTNSSDCDQAIIFAPMRRGGRMIYAFDVTTPSAPKLLWKKGCRLVGACDPGFEELGQTWSIPQPYSMNIGGATTPVLVFGGGYDQATEDADPVVGADSMGRAIVFINGQTGAPIKVFKGAGTAVNTDSGSDMTTDQATAAGAMLCSIPADVSVLTKDPDTGYTVNAFRAYVGDVCGHLFRIDMSDPDPNNWIITLTASVGGSGVNNRKFLFPPDVVYGGHDSNGAYHYILMGSGDREHPFNGYGDAAHPASNAVINRFYMFKDYNTSNGYTANSSAPKALANPFPVGVLDSNGIPCVPVATCGAMPSSNAFPVHEATLYDATNDLIQLGSAVQQTATLTQLDRYQGWYITLSAGEKTVGGATASNGYVYFGTNKPATFSNICTNNLGEARLYQVNIATAGAAPPVSNNSSTSVVTSVTQRYDIIPGGGLPPTPVPVSVIIDGKAVEGVIAGTKVSTPSTSVMGNRIRTYTRKKIDKK